MADIQTTFCFDDDLKTGEFDINVHDELMTSYDYSADTISITAITSPVTLSLEDAITLSVDIGLFSNQILVRFGPISGKTSPYKVEIEKKATTLCTTIEVEGTLLTSLEFDSTTGTVTFQPRAASILAWSDYLLWQSFLDRTLSEIREF